IDLGINKKGAKKRSSDELSGDDKNEDSSKKEMDNKDVKKRKTKKSDAMLGDDKIGEASGSNMGSGQRNLKRSRDAVLVEDEKQRDKEKTNLFAKIEQSDKEKTDLIAKLEYYVSLIKEQSLQDKNMALISEEQNACARANICSGPKTLVLVNASYNAPGLCFEGAKFE
ncbi:27482_t:CDS:2, partial [Racocetra persica]